MTAAFKLNLPSTDKFVLVAMADYAQDDGTHCYPSVETLARKTNLCERSVRYALRRLELAKLLVAQGVSNGRTPTKYRIALENSVQGILGGTSCPVGGQSKTPNPAPVAPNPSLTVIEPKKEAPLFFISQTKTRKQQELESELQVGGNPYRPSAEWYERKRKELA